jgi:hypothetical protein
MPQEIIAAIPFDQEESDIVIPDSLLNSWLDEFPPGPRLVTLTTEAGVRCIVGIGSTHPEEGIHVPRWVLKILGIPDGAMYVTMEPYLG